MALSNWETAAWDKNGNPMPGVLTVGSISIEIYKNWIYVRDSETWKSEPCGFGHNVIMEIQFGDVQYRGFRIKAIRGPQNSIMAVIQYGYSSNDNYQVMYAIGAYAYSRRKCVGILPNTVKKFRESKFFRGELIEFPEFKGLEQYNQGDAFIVKELFGESPKIVATKIGECKPTILERMLSK